MPGDDASLNTSPEGWPVGFGAGGRERAALLVLASLRGITPARLHALAWREGSAAACVSAIQDGRAGSAADQVWANRLDPELLCRRVERADARFVGPCDGEYPPEVLALHDPPVGLFFVGKRLPDLQSRVAIVGSRAATALGREIATDLGRALGEVGATVVSGAARGIDAASHRGALQAEGNTVAVLGSGIDRPYPRSSRELIEQIAQRGTVVSEYGPGLDAEPFRFPARNRLIAALARALVVVEGGVRSGSRSSVDHALDLGREVFAVPGPVTSPLAQTPLEMIRDGAALIRGSDDLINDLGFERRRLHPPTMELGDEERRVWEALTAPSLPDAVARSARLSVPEAMTVLMRLELRHLVRSVGGRYERRLQQI